MFVREAQGLRALAAAQAIRVPAVLAVSDKSLVLERIRPGQAGKDFFRDQCIE